MACWGTKNELSNFTMIAQDRYSCVVEDATYLQEHNKRHAYASLHWLIQYVWF